MELGRMKAEYPLTRAWRDLGLSGEPGPCVCSPLRPDRSPSFSVFDNGQRFKDFATGESGDVFDFVARVRNCSVASAIAFVRDRVGAPVRRPDKAQSSQKRATPSLRLGSDAELRELANQRGFSVEALSIAQARGFLRFTNLWGYSAWCLTDERQALFEFRRLDGNKWPEYGRLSARKSHCMGHGKRWPIGAVESKPFTRIAWVEGAPDFLGAVHLLNVEHKLERVAPVAVLGAANHALDPQALSCFAGKTVWIYPHRDEAGMTAARRWAQQLKTAGAAQVRAFDLSRLRLVDGTEGKDLADVARISPDCFECERKFWEVMP
jgi:hypothetical protein